MKRVLCAFNKKILISSNNCKIIDFIDKFYFVESYSSEKTYDIHIDILFNGYFYEVSNGVTLDKVSDSNIFSYLNDRIMMSCCDSLGTDCFYLHSACFLANENTVVVVTNTSGSGKSTFVALCLDKINGTMYLSDDIICFTPQDKKIMGFPSAIRMKIKAPIY